MREFLEDAEGHRYDGYGRAQELDRVELPKRFYKDVGIGAVDNGFTVTLDGRATRTPGRAPVLVPSVELAKLMAEEWAAQGEHIDPTVMPMVRLVNSALEGGDARVPALREEIVKFAGGDLMLYRADGPAELVAAQEAAWDTALMALARRFAVSFQPTIGIVHQTQPPVLARRIAEVLEPETILPLTALVSVTGLTGSGLLAIGLRHGLFDPDTVWTAAHVDEDFNIERWGAVDEAMERRALRRSEFDTAVTLLRLIPTA